jgi:folate-binding Fe-S cluster repair protein YgfZ
MHRCASVLLDIRINCRYHQHKPKNQGRVLYDVFIYTHTTPSGSPGYLIEYDSRASSQSAAGPLLPMLKRYVLRSKVKLRDVSNEYDVWAAWGSEFGIETRKWNWARSGAVEPDWSGENEWPWGTQQERIQDRRAVGMGTRMLVRKGDKRESNIHRCNLEFIENKIAKESSTHDLASSDAYTLHRILRGVPEGIEDIPPLQAFPMDSNLDIMGGCQCFSLFDTATLT